MTTDDYITTTGERWTVDNDGAMCLADKSGVAAYLIDDQRIYAELRALRAIIDKHDLCHNQHGKVDARAFADGCTAEQRKHYGCAPDADEVVALRAQRDELLAALEGLDRHEAMACIVEPPCGDCRARNARATLRRAKGEA